MQYPNDCQEQDRVPAFFVGTGDWGLGTGDWGLGTGDWGLGTGDWGLGTGDWGLEMKRTRRITMPHAPCPMPHACPMPN
ncbi:MAG: hypothetical protein V7L26_05165 [Nostoc sp.]|uniref:hypothetical protein n=1 Tax=Nostoc sp. TaxID=1180 RepID=UPI002FF115EB